MTENDGQRLAELATVPDRAQNPSVSTQIGMILLDRDLRIKHYTVGIQAIFNVTPADLNRPFEHVTHTLHYDGLTADAAEVNRTLATISREVQTGGGQWYLLELLPYCTLEQQIEGVLLTCVDITLRKQQEQETCRLVKRLEQQTHLLNTTLTSIRDFAYIFDRNGHFCYANQPLLDLLGITLEDIIGKNFFDLKYPPDLAARLQKQIQTVFDTGVFVKDETPFMSPTGIEGFYEYIFTPVFTDSGSAVEVVAGSTREITDRKKIETELYESEGRLQKALSIETVGVLFFTLAGEFTDVNAAFLRMSGFSREVMTSGTLKWGDLTPPEWMECSQRSWEELKSTGRTTPYEKQYFRKDGSRFWGLFAASLINGNEVVEYVIDISERKQAEEALRRSEERFRGIVNQATAGIAESDLTGNVIFANQRFCDIVGYTLEELMGGTKVQDFAHPEDLLRNLGLYEKCVTDGTPFIIEKRYIRKDGSIVWVSNSVSLVRDAEGKPRNAIAVTLDITERKQVEAALRESEKRFHAVADLVPDLLWSNEPRGVADWYNQRWLEYTGQTFNAAQGNGWLDAAHPDDRETSLRSFQAALDSGEPLRYEQRIRGSDGSYRWFLVQARPRHDEAGQIVSWYGAATDIHEERMALAAEQVARAAAEAALQTRDQFLSIASHELRTPLTSLIGYAHMFHIAATQGKGDVAKMTERIIRQAERLNTLIEQLLDLPRLQRGQFAIERQPVDVAVVVAQVVEEFRTTLPPNTKHPVELIHPDEPVIIAGDAQRLEQVIQNLLSNAVKYSPMGGPVCVQVLCTATEAIVEIEDHGIGIPTDAHAHLFEPFYRAANSGSQASGFGLGLYIVREIVQRHGGRVEVRSTAGVGSIIRVVLPLRDSEDAMQFVERPPTA